jgi:hypothetical protein
MISALTGDTYDVDFRSFLRMVDVLLQCAVISKALTAPPGSPANGDRYIVAASPTGAWSGHAKSIAVWTTDNPATPGGLWEFYAPKFGWMAPNLADATVYVYDGSAWTALAGGGGGTLAGDTDVALTSPSNGQILSYDFASSKWKNTTPSGGGTLAGDTDVALSSPTNGQVLTYDSGTSKWKNAASGGGGGGGTYPVVGTPIIKGNRGTGTNFGFNGYTNWAQLPGGSLRILAATWKIVYAACGGTGISIAGASVIRTLPGDLVPIDSTPILFGGSATHVAAFGSTPTVTAPAFVTSDAIAIQLDRDHDYWIGLFHDNDGAGYNAAIHLFFNPINPEIFGQYQGGGDQRANNPLTTSAYNTLSPGFWDVIFVS